MSSSAHLHLVSWKRGARSSQSAAAHKYAYKQHHGANGILIKSKGMVTVVWVPTSVALRGVSRSTGDETRQPADFNRVASLRLSLSLSLPPRTGAKPMGAVSARVVGGWYRVGALPTVGDPTSHFGRLAGTMWPVSEGERGKQQKRRSFKRMESTVTIYTAPGGSLRVRVS